MNAKRAPEEEEKATANAKRAPQEKAGATIDAYKDPIEEPINEDEKVQPTLPGLPQNKV